MNVKDLLETIRAHGQAHVLAFWDGLDEAERGRLLGQLAALDFGLLDRLTKDLLAPDAAASKPPVLEPAPLIELPKTEAERDRFAEARAAGEAALRAGRVGCFLVAGGQGTRLGFDGPKGAYVIGPVTRRTIFQLHAEKILALRRRYGAKLPWVVMTSTANDAATRAFFEARGFFGLDPASVRFIVQENMPAVDRRGKLLLETRSSLALSPNGHGGSIKALHESGACAWLAEQGVDTLFYFQVDNVLVKIADPVFLGFHLQAGAEMSSKAVRKRDWREKVGVLGRVDGRLGVIEYSDLPEDLAKAANPDGSLRFAAGNIAIHLLDVGFVERLNAGGFRLPFHKAEKAVPCVGPDGRPVQLKPGEKNGVKFETFVFDALPRAKASVTLEVAREADFAPVKNAEGEDSPATARAYLVAEAAAWLEAAGRRVPRQPGGMPDLCLELSPLTSFDGQGLAGLTLPELKPGLKLAL
ncbi:MAG: UDPGP type 1 family protein [Planctomycetota bacterium]|nr:UDPGP type 1 family protein [Planctomycetota bacterium]